MLTCQLHLVANSYLLATRCNDKVAILEYSDKNPDVWYSIAGKAQKAGLISHAFCGAIFLAHPKEQIKKGHYHRIQIANNGQWRCKKEQPKIIQLNLFGGIDETVTV